MVAKKWKNVSHIAKRSEYYTLEYEKKLKLNLKTELIEYLKGFIHVRCVADDQQRRNKKV